MADVADGIESTEDPAPRRGSLAATSLPVVVPLAFPFLAAAAYSLMRNAYVRFYGQYGVAPEDVGIGQTHFLSGVFRFCLAGQFLRDYTALKLAALVVAMVGCWMAVVRFCLWSRRFARAVPGDVSRIVVAVALYLAVLMVFLIGTSLIVMPKDRAFAARRIEEGRGVGPNDLALLSLHATPARLAPTSDDGPELPDDVVLYLGRNEGVVVVHDPATSTTWRVPEAAVVVELLADEDTA